MQRILVSRHTEDQDTVERMTTYAQVLWAFSTHAMAPPLFITLQPDDSRIVITLKDADVHAELVSAFTNSREYSVTKHSISGEPQIRRKSTVDTYGEFTVAIAIEQRAKL